MPISNALKQQQKMGRFFRPDVPFNRLQSNLWWHLTMNCNFQQILLICRLTEYHVSMHKVRISNVDGLGNDDNSIDLIIRCFQNVQP